MMKTILKTKIKEIQSLCTKYGVKKLYAFGSVVSDKFSANSDVDLLITFSDSLSIEEYSNNYFSIHDKFEKILGREIDLVTEKSLSNPYFIQSIENSKVLIYEA